MSESGTQKAKYEESPAPASPTAEAARPDVVEQRGLDGQFLDYYGLNEQPFGVTPDLRFLYLGPKHKQALDALNYHTELNRGFLTLIAEPGMGKTSLLFHYLEGLRQKARTVYLFQTDCNATELMRYLLADLGLDGMRTDLPEMRNMLNQVLLAELQAGRRFVLVIDEAQNLDDKVLESIRLLSNFETPWAKLIHIVLAGQPQLGDRLAQPSMKQLQQRVAFAIRLEPFTRSEVDLYIDHRLWVAGYKGVPLFSPGARALIADHSEGIPRNINNICFCAMSCAWAMGQKSVDRAMMSGVLEALNPDRPVEKETPATKLPDEPKIPNEPKTNVSQPPPSSGLTMKAPQDASRVAKVATATLVLLALGWFAIQFDIGKKIAPSLHTFSSAIRSLILPGPAPNSATPGTVASPDNSPENPKTQAVPHEQNTNLPPQDAIESSTDGGRQD